MALLTTKETAERLNISVRRVHQLIEVGRLPAEKMGRDYFINDEDLKLVEDRKPGRPRKSSGAEAIERSSKSGRKKQK
jgi:excisionase family DNA binding protein